MAQNERWKTGIPVDEPTGSERWKSGIPVDAPEAPGLLRGAGDSAVALGTGVIQGVKMLSDVAGADNAVSRTLGDAASSVDSLTSPFRKAERQARARKIQEAEQSGSTWEEVKANVGSFAEAPLDTTLNALGTSAPTLAAAALSGGTSIPLQIAARAAPVALGALQGTGAAKGQIYESVEQQHLKAGATPEQAAARASQAQSYSGDNIGNIGIAAGLGALAGSTGAEGAIARLAGRKAGQEAVKQGLLKSAGIGVLKESPMEALQGGQERYTSNVALQREGFDTPTFQGVAGQATLEGLASAPMGGGFGAMEARSGRAAQPAIDPQTIDPITSEQPMPESSGMGYNPDAGGTTVFQDGSQSYNMEQPIKPSEAMGIDPAAGPLSRAAATAVDSGATIQPEIVNAQQTQADPAVAQAADGAISEEIAEPVSSKPVRINSGDVGLSGAPQDAQQVPAVEPVADPRTAAPDLVTLESRSIDELRQSLRNAQDPAIRRAVAEEIRRRREVMPDPLQQQEISLEPKTVETQQEQPKESQAQPATEGVTDVANQTKAASSVAQKGSSIEDSRYEPEVLGEQRQNQESDRAIGPSGSDVPGDASRTAGAADNINKLKNAGDASQAKNSTTDATATEAQGLGRAGVSGVDEQGAVPALRPTRWRQNGLQAGKVARGLGLDPKGKRLAQIVAEIDAKDGVQLSPEKRADTIRESMTVDQIKAERDRNSERAQKIAQSIDPVAMPGRTALDFMSKEERDYDLALRLALPSTSDDVASAKERIAKRVADRKAKANVQDAQSRPAGAEAQAAPVEASTADRGDAAAAGAVSAKAGAGDVQADGVKKTSPAKTEQVAKAPAEPVKPEPAPQPNAEKPAEDEAIRAQTKTPAFQKWFGESKVVDESGKPMVMYHGTSNTEDGNAFTMFDAYGSNYGLFGQGAYFTNDPEVASSYTSKGKGKTPTVYSAFMSIKNPIDMDAKADPAAWESGYPEVDFETWLEDGDTNESYYRAAEEHYRDAGYEKWEGAESMQDGLRRMGFDGITHIGGGRVKSEGKKHRVFIAFTPEQIKSATGNRGTFDSANPDIRLDAATGDSTQTTYTPAQDAQQKAVTAFAERLSKNRDSFVLMDAVKPSGARQQEAQAVANLAKTMFGREVIFVKFKGRPLFNGAVSTTDPGKIFVNIESARPMMAVLGHELLHELRKSNPAAYNQLAKTLKTVTKDDYIYEALLKQKYRDQGLNWTPQDISEELYGDIVGDNFMDPKFWEAIAGDKPILAKQLYRAVMNWIDKIASMFKRVKARQDGSMVLTLAEQADGSRPFGTQKYLQDIEAARSAVAQAMGQFGKTNPQGQTDALSIADAVEQIKQFDSWGAPEKSKFDDLIYKLQDKQIDTKRVVEAIREAGGRLKDATNVYLQEELFHGRAAARTEDFVNKELAPLVNMMRLRGIDIPALDEYLHARHAEEANKLIAKRNPEIQDGGSGMTTKAAREYLEKLTPADKAKFESVAAKVDEILGATRQMYADYSLESQEKVDGWGKMFDHYVPLMREDKDGGMGIGQGFSIKGKEVKGRTGSTRKVVDILANIAMQRERAIVRGEKNRVATALVGLAKTNPNKDFWSVGPPPAKKVYDPELDAVVERQDPLFKSRENVVVAKIKAKNGMVLEQAVMFNEDNERAMRMAAALKNLDAAGLEGLLGVSAKITRYFAAINTQYNPIFGAVNLVRDVQGALFNLTSTPLKGKAGIIGQNTLSALKGIYLDARAARDGKTPSSQWAKLWEEFQNEGGQTGFRDMFTNSADRAKAIERELNPTAWMDSPLGQVFTANGALKVPLSVAQKKATGMFGWLSDYNLAMENAVRLSSYKAAIDQGMSKQQAASLAKNLTVNFNRKGQVGQQAGALYAFFNASMQGTARLGQTLFDMEPGKPKTIRLSRTGKNIVYGGVLLGSMQAMLLAAAGFDEDEPPEFVRERSLIIPTGGNSYITIPMPLGLHVLPNLGRIPTEFAMGGFKNPAQMIEKMLVLVSGAFNPIGGGASLVQMLSPTAVDPMVAIAENKDWTGKPIAKTSHNQAIPGHLLTKDTASAPAKLLAEAINILSGGTEYTAGVLSPTPDQIDYLFGQVTGGVGREVSKVQQSGSAMVTGEDLPIYKVPLVGRFYGDTDTQSAQSGKFYAAINELNIHEAQIKGLRKDGRGAEASEYIRENPEARLFMAANAAERDVQKLRGLKRELVKSGAPADRVKEIEQRINDRMTRFNEAVKRLREQEAA